MDLLGQGLEILAQAGVVVGALLSILGGLKVLARYTSSEADDKALEAIEAFLVKIRDLATKFKKH
jgi:uncharacterized protein YbbC (DUF1343 family)